MSAARDAMAKCKSSSAKTQYNHINSYVLVIVITCDIQYAALEHVGDFISLFRSCTTSFSVKSAAQGREDGENHN